MIVFTSVQNAHAGVFSFVSDFFGSSANAQDIEEKQTNSQTIPLLEASLGTDSPSLGVPNVIDDTVLEVASGPGGTAKEVADKTGLDKVVVYTVRDGDTLASVAKMFGVTPNTIKWANDVGSSLKKGQELVILPISGVKYIVKKGDTLKGIASKFKGDVNEILDYNEITMGTLLVPGMEIIIPDGEINVPATSVAKPSLNTVSSGGYFIRPTRGVKTQGLHGKNRSAVDIAGPVGTSIYAAASGKVIVAKTGGWNGGYGNYIVIQHDNGMQSLYGHLSRVDVSAGDRVSQGDFIGKMGSTGNSTGSHLHFEILGARNWNPFN